METCQYLDSMKPHITDVQRGMDSAYQMAEEACHACMSSKEVS